MFFCLKLEVHADIYLLQYIKGCVSMPGKKGLNFKTMYAILIML